MEGPILAGRYQHSDHLCAYPHILTVPLGNTPTLRLLAQTLRYYALSKPRVWGSD